MKKYFRFKKGELVLQAMVLPAIISIVIFSLIPISGIVISFMNYRLGSNIFRNEWVGLKHFFDMFSDRYFLQALRNTFIISLLDLAFCFPAPIILALIFNEIPLRRFKKFAQTASYLPHFLSYVVVAAFWKILLDSDGVVNSILTLFGMIQSPVEFWTTKELYWPLTVVVSLWKGVGWGAIIYFAAITNVNMEVYEAAIVDGAGRLRRVISIILPTMMGTIAVLFILRMAGLLNASFDQSYLFGNPFNREVSYVVSHYTIDMGLRQLRLSYATAISFLQSVVSLFLLLLTNAIAKKIRGSSIF